MGQDLEKFADAKPQRIILSLWGFLFIYIYKWLNGVMAVAEGCLKPGGVEYQVFELVNG